MLPPDLRYTKEHIWARLENGNIRVGITDFAQEKLDDIVFVELPAVGTHIKVDQKIGIIESVKDTSNLLAPVTGEVVEVNQALEDEPELVNNDPYGGGWMIVIKPSDPKEIENLLTADAYQKMAFKTKPKWTANSEKATDNPFITTLLKSPVSTAAIARIKDESEKIFTSIIIHEDTEHVSRLPKEVPVRVRAGFIKARNVGLMVVIVHIYRELYETWWNYHNPVYRECWRDILRQDKLLLSFHIDSPEPARILWVPNTLKGIFRSATAKILGMEPWTMNAFDVAKEKLYRKYPTPKDLWDNLVD